MTENNHNRDLGIQNFASADDLYNSVRKEGSLGLLALGWQGLFLWRKKRIEMGDVSPPVENTAEKDEAAGPENNI